MTLKQIRVHNQNVIAEVTKTLLEYRIVDPIAYVSDPQYAARCIRDYVQAYNLIRTTMNLPPLVIYNESE